MSNKMQKGLNLQLYVQMILDWSVWDVLTNSAVIVNSSEEACIKMTLIEHDRMSHVKGCRNSCSLANSVAVEWSRSNWGNEET